MGRACRLRLEHDVLLLEAITHGARVRERRGLGRIAHELVQDPHDGEHLGHLLGDIR